MTRSQREKDQRILTIIVLIVLALVIIQTISNIVQTFRKESQNRILETTETSELSEPRGIGSASYGGDIGAATMCLNSMPVIIDDCNLTNATLNLSNRYNCTFIAIDGNGDAINFSEMWYTEPALLTVLPNGSTRNFTLRRVHMEHLNVFRVYATDTSQCANNNSYKEFNITVVGENRAPYLARNFSNEKVIKDYYVNLYMNDYFIEPDEDPMGYFYVILTGGTVSIRFAGNRAEIRGVSCGISTLYFVATDPFGLTAVSNIVQYEVECPGTSEQPSGQKSESGRGGGGGGGDSTSCTPEWKCSVWSACRPDNTSYRRCIDFNACNPKEYIHYFTKNCSYEDEINCIEKWECSEWSTCEDGIHTRLCLDRKNCGTTTDMPPEMENCSKIPSCFNHVQDPGETGIDCGGPCGACREIEEPSEPELFNAIAVVTALFVTGTLSALGYIFRKKIAALYNRIFGKKPKRQRKVFINEKQKEKLLQLLNIMQARLDEGKINHSIDESVLLTKEYFKQLLSIDNLDQAELLAKIVNLKDKDLEKLLVMFYAKATSIVHLRNRGAEIKTEEVQELIDEISHNIYLIAEFKDQDAINSPKDRTTTSKGDLEQIFNSLSNMYIALKFGELIVAKNIYKETIRIYENLSAKEKSIPYTDIIRAFHAVHYLEKQYKEG